MKEGQRLWSKDELILAINLFSKLTFGQMSQGNAAIKDLAGLIDRTPASVAYKLVNFASLDPELKRRGIKGMGNASKLDKAVWQDICRTGTNNILKVKSCLPQRNILQLRNYTI